MMIAKNVFKLLLFICMTQRLILAVNSLPEKKHLLRRRIKKLPHRQTEVSGESLRFQEQKWRTLGQSLDRRMHANFPLNEEMAAGDDFFSSKFVNSNLRKGTESSYLLNSLPAYRTFDEEQLPTNNRGSTRISFATLRKNNKRRLTRSPKIKTKHLYKASVNSLASVISPDFPVLMGFISPPVNCEEDKCWTRTASGECQRNLRCLRYNW